MKSQAISIGIDIGGTNTKIGAVSLEGKLLSKHEYPSLDFVDVNNTLKIFAAFLKKNKFSLQDICAIGIDVPCPVINDKTIKKAVNFNSNFSDIFSFYKKNIPHAKLAILNDANAAALGEGWSGSAQEVNSYLVVTLGTGLGAGIVLNGALLEGVHGAAGELGHYCIHPQGRLCNCKKRGCFETYASARGLVMNYCEQSNTIDAEDVTAFDVCQKARAGQKDALSAIERFGTDLGFGLALAMHVVDCEMICIGGGVSKSFDLFEKPMLASFCDNNKFAGSSTKIMPASLGNDAGIIGSAYFALQKLEKN